MSEYTKYIPDIKKPWKDQQPCQERRQCVNCGRHLDKIEKHVCIFCRAVQPCQACANREWVSVEDRLPEDREEVLVHFTYIKSDDTPSCGVGITSVHKQRIWGLVYDSNFTQNVTHWMPLPKSPQEVTNED